MSWDDTLSSCPLPQSAFHEFAYDVGDKTSAGSKPKFALSRCFASIDVWFWKYLDWMKIDGDISIGRLSKSRKLKNPICQYMAPHFKNVIWVYYRATSTWVVCVMTFLHTSNRLVVNHKKHIWPLEGASYQKYYRCILSSYPNSWGSVLWLFSISLTV